MQRRLGLGTGLVLAALVGALLIWHFSVARSFVATISVGGLPSAVALDARTGLAFAVDGVAARVSVLDIQHDVVLRTVPVVPAPMKVVVDSRTSRAFVLNSAGAFSLLNTRNGAVLRTMTGARRPVSGPLRP